jgi:hypothetical protein
MKMKIRILCLHDENSSAVSLIDQLQLLGKRLQHNHNIELAFVNAPHIVISPRNKSNTNDDEDFQDQDHGDHEKQRVWYYKSKEKIGLDASILHLRQIWTRSLHSNPFSGILGVGQGAAIAGLLPVLSSYETITVRQDDGQDEDDDESNDDETIRPMFENLKFCIFVNGWDLLLLDSNHSDQVDQEAKDKSEEENDDESTLRINNVPSLHVISSQDNQSGEMKLFERYGGGTSDSQAEKCVLDNCPNFSSSSKSMKIINVLGKFIVAQKKKLTTQWKSAIQDSVAHQDSTNDSQQDNHHSTEMLGNTDGALLLLQDMERTRMELARVEQEALELIQQTISENPPKALMAMIMPDSQRGGSIVGGWDGDRDAFRSEEFIRSGGAPCPREFTLPFKVRKQQPGDSSYHKCIEEERNLKKL